MRVPDYCCYSKYQRNLAMTYVVKKKDNEAKKRREIEKAKKNGVLQQLNGDSNKVQRNKTKNSASTRQNDGNQQEENKKVNSQDQWQVQRRRGKMNTQPQEKYHHQKNQRGISNQQQFFRPRSPQTKKPANKQNQHKQPVSMYS